MNRYDEIKALVDSLADDMDKFYNKNNKTAGTRARKTLQDLKALAQTARAEIQDMKKV
jgi:ABC-type Zn uptake system ZnuABC Zn-binding protein ZnuA